MTRRKAKSPLDAETIRDLLKEFEASTAERGTALLACAWLEDSLDAFIVSRCVNHPKTIEDMHNRGALESFSAKTNTAFAFGLIDEDMKAELDTLRDGYLRDGQGPFRYDLLRDCGDAGGPSEEGSTTHRAPRQNSVRQGEVWVRDGVANNVDGYHADTSK